ncbi:hypothetical protein IFM89_029028 [Coptis chinensis]|uniref:Clp ATPase C-terminal domain-containing protein n=1 Tax=Coptis chinensis TaxID=261450 RepID=A0A835M4M5_9MAGN|nr:hypothetical protein IFM89_029028 [Coptis chinensis]
MGWDGRGRKTKGFGREDVWSVVTSRSNATTFVVEVSSFISIRNRLYQRSQWQLCSDVEKVSFVERAERGIALAVSDVALDVVLSKSYDPVYGARPVRRWLEKKVVTELSKMLIRGEIDENSSIYIDASPIGDKLAYRREEWGPCESKASVKKSIYRLRYRMMGRGMMPLSVPEEDPD